MVSGKIVIFLKILSALRYKIHSFNDLTAILQEGLVGWEEGAELFKNGKA